MRNKVYMYINEEEKSIVVSSLIDLKNELHEQGRFTDCVDELILKLMNCKKKKVKTA